MNATNARRLTTAMAGPAIALGVLAGTMVVAAPAEANFQDHAKCTDIPMPTGLAASGPGGFAVPGSLITIAC